MEGELVVSPVLDMLTDKLNAIADTCNSGLPPGIIEKLLLVIDDILARVLVVEQKLQPDNESLQWLERVREVAYGTDDLLDRIIKHNRLKFFLWGSAKKMMKKFRKLSDFEPKAFKKVYPNITRHILAHANISGPVDRGNMWPLKFNEIAGRHVEKEKILSWMTGEEVNFQISILAIVGDDGIGKTTMAQSVYQDIKVCDRFDLKAWVSVNAKVAQEDDFSIAKIGKVIVESLTGISCEPTTIAELDNLVRDTLESGRFLIILDDIYSISEEMRVHIMTRWFSAAAPGSKVIVTSTSNEVATDIGAHEILPFHALPHDESVSLFNLLTFHPFSVPRSPVVEAIATELVSTCEGNPLCLELVGNLMRFQNTEADWASVRAQHDEISKLKHPIPSLPSHIGKIMLLCYHSLPSHLKHCFAYCSFFSNYNVLQKEKLIHIWIANGLVQPIQHDRTLEDIASSYLEELIRRSFLVLVKGKPDLVKECGMHSLIHDFATYVASLESNEKGGVIRGQSQRLRQAYWAYHSESGSTTIPDLLPARNVRALSVLSGECQSTVHHSIFTLKSLRVLDIEITGIQRLAHRIGDLHHLRYLDLSQTLIKRLPSSITKLKHLQTLNLSMCSRLQKLPEGIFKLTDLRNLDISSCHSLTSMPSGIGKLCSLQSLPVFLVGKGKKFAQLGELRRLNLKGRLHIKHLENARHVSEAHGARLHEKKYLDCLGLSWDHDVRGSSLVPSDLLLESLWPPPNLTVLDIKGYQGNKFPSWMRDSTIYFLTKIFITNCGCEELPPLGHLPYLRKLHIRQMTKLKSIMPEFYGNNLDVPFRSLENMEFSDMPVLVEWFDIAPLEAFPCLQTLTVEDCPKLEGIPFLPSLMNLVLWNSNKNLLHSLSKRTSLSSLVINEYEIDFVNVLGNSITIEKLMIHRSGFKGYCLEGEPQEFASVQHLGVLYCYEMTSFLASLSYLTSLKKLEIIGCHDLELIPDVMRRMPLLEELIIEGCPLLASLPIDMQYLTRLVKLIIKGCPEILCPLSVLRDLKSLQYLLISECPKLEIGLAKDEVWDKMSHALCIIAGRSNKNEYEYYFSSQRSSSDAVHGKYPGASSSNN